MPFPASAAKSKPQSGTNAGEPIPPAPSPLPMPLRKAMKRPYSPTMNAVSLSRSRAPLIVVAHTISAKQLQNRDVGRRGA